MNGRVERWHRISELFDRVADLEAGERERVLSAECAGDPQSRAEVERLLAADERTCPVDRDIAAQASTLLLEGDPHEHEGERFGAYRIVKLVGQGGMGRVYLAEREGEDFAQTVALKVVGGHGSFDAGTARRRFLDERRILARLQHPHIARLLDGGVGPEAQPWFAMEYVDGAPLTEWCDARKLSVHARLTLFAKVCDAVDHAHRFLIVHRDLKPGNVLVDGAGEPKVLDFGIAKLLDEGGQDRTGSTILMTPDYAAPEQIRGGQISTATDVYALGAVLFELLTGRKPFCDPLASREPPQASRVATEAGANTGERAAARDTTAHSLRNALRGDLDRILRTALDPDPARRYRSATSLGEDLRAVAAGQPISLRRDRAYRVRVFLRRHRLGAGAAAAAVLGLMATTGWALWQTRVATERAETAQREALAAESISQLLLSSFEAADPQYMDRAGAEPTARDVLDAGAASATKELAQTPVLLARVRLMLGRTYLNLRHDDKAAELLAAAAQTYASPSVNDPDKTSEALALLAQVEQNRGDYAKAVDLSRRVLALRQRLQRPAEEIATGYNTLGMTLISALRYDEADNALRRAQAMFAQTQGEHSAAVSEVLTNRGVLAVSAGRPQVGERLLREALDMKNKLGAPKAKQFAARSLLALATAKLGGWAEAEAALSKNVELAPEIYPGDDLRLARAQQRLGLVRYHQGDLIGAQASLEEAIAAYARTPDPRSAAMANATRIWADVLEARGDIEAATRAYRTAETIMNEQANSSRNYDLLQVVATHGVFLARHGRQGAARARAEKMLKEWIAMFGRPTARIPEDLAPARLLLTEYELLQGDTQAAQAALFAEQAVAGQPLLQARRRYWQARIHAARGDIPAALAEYARAIEQAETTVGADMAHAALWRLDYIEQLAKAGQAAEARKQYALAQPALAAQLLPTAPSITRMKLLAQAIAAGNRRPRRMMAATLP